MEIVVPVKMVPDIVEELEIDAGGRALDRSFLKFKLNEFDDQALEQALVLKEKHGGRVTVVALQAEEVDETLFTCLAKGAERAVKIKGAHDNVSSHQAAAILALVLKSIPYDLILTGVQAADDIDGQMAPLLATLLGLPHVSVVSAVEPAAEGRVVLVRQEYAGGVMAELEVSLPAVLGIQVAPQTPRYAPVSKVRQIMKTAKIEEVEAPPAQAEAWRVTGLRKPEAAGGAQMLEGSADEVAEKLVALFTEKGLLKG